MFRQGSVGGGTAVPEWGFMASQDAGQCELPDKFNPPRRYGLAITRGGGKNQPTRQRQRANSGDSGPQARYGLKA